MCLIKESKVETINIGKLKVFIDDAISMVFLTAPCLADRGIVFHGTLDTPVKLDLNTDVWTSTVNSDHYTAIIQGDDILITFGCGPDDSYRIDVKEFRRQVWDLTLGKYEWLKDADLYSVVPYSDKWCTYYAMSMPVHDQPVYCIVVYSHDVKLDRVRFRNIDDKSCEVSSETMLSTTLFYGNVSIPVPEGYNTSGFTSTAAVSRRSKDREFINLIRSDIAAAELKM